MRTDETIIRTAIGDPTFSLGRRVRPIEMSALRKYRLELPQGYRRGFPPVWDFAIVPDRTKTRAPAERHAVVQDADNLIEALGRNPGVVPLVIISTDESIDLSGELTPDHPNVFYIESDEVLAPQGAPLELYFSPFMRAIRKKFSEQEARAYMMTPYLPGNPVSDWRFFGRERELQRLISSPQNFIIVGARRTGKTSLMKELERRLNQAQIPTILVDVQFAENEGQLVDAILDKIDLKRKASLLRRKEIMTSSLLAPSLKMISAPGNAVLLIDEIGNVITNMPKEAWKVLGVLRSSVQLGNLRIIATTSQEFFLRQQEDYSGPWVNFATAMRIGGFRNDELEDFVAKPLQLWGLLRNRNDKNSLIDLVSSAVGRNPLLLASFCQTLFHDAVTGNVNDALPVARAILQNKLIPCFSDTLKEVFHDIPSPTLKYLFLRKCYEVELRQEPIDAASFDLDWIDGALTSAGYTSTMMLRRNLLEDMRARALTEPTEGNADIQTVIAPIVYRVIRRQTEKFERLIEKFRGEIKIEATKLGLTPVSLS